MMLNEWAREIEKGQQGDQKFIRQAFLQVGQFREQVEQHWQLLVAAVV